MRLATYNVENLFDRAKAMNLESWRDGSAVLADYKKLNDLIGKKNYTDKVKADLIEIMSRHDGLLTRGASEFLCLREIRGKLLKKKTKNNPAVVLPAGRADWIGWFELETEPVKASAVANTGRVIGLLNADVLCVVEAEDRTGLKRFNETVLPDVGVMPFEHVMLIDGNDDRGIDVGILCKRGFRIVGMCSHVDDTDDKGEIFSRDCAEFEIETPSGNMLRVMINHFKSKGYGDQKSSAAKRLRQATRVRELYEDRLRENEHIAIVGDLNETPGEAPMDPLIRQGSTLTDVMVHPNFAGDGRPGTYGSGTKSGKLDYILMSPKMSAAAASGGIERKGVWAGKNGTIFPHLPEIEAAVDAASDHAALFVDLNL